MTTLIIIIRVNYLFDIGLVGTIAH